MSSHLIKSLVFLVAAASTADAGIAFDLRVADLNDVPASDPKNVPYPKIGDVLTLDLFVTITGAEGNPGLEGFQSFFTGSFITPGGNLDADFLSSMVVAPFNATASNPGTIQDLDGDGDLDLGSNSTSPSNPTDHAGVRSASMTTGNPSGLGPSTFYVFSVDLLINWPPVLDVPEDVIFRLSDWTSPLSAEVSWLEDGVFKNSRPTFSGLAAVNLGEPVHIGVPEPGVGALLLVGLGALTARRRRGEKLASQFVALLHRGPAPHEHS